MSTTDPYIVLAETTHGEQLRLYPGGEVVVTSFEWGGDYDSGISFHPKGPWLRQLLDETLKS